MVRRVLTGLCVGFMCIFVASCGQTYKLQSITVTPGTADSAGNSSINLEGDGAFQQLTVTAHYSNTKSQDVTVNSTYELGASQMGELIAPLESVSVNKSGMVNVLNYACTWDTEPTNPPTDSTFVYAVLPYKVTVSYTENGVTSTAYLDVNVANIGGYCFDGTGVKPYSGFPGNSVAGY
jgi:hypothetical protein